MRMILFLATVLMAVPVSGAQIETKNIANSAITNAKIANGTIDLTTKVTGTLPVGNGGTGQTTAVAQVPSGTVIMFGGSTCPSGYLALDGTAVSRTTYSALFALMSTTYGSGDGSTTFNLPNTKGVFIRGSGSQTISGQTYSGTRGTTTADGMHSHNHIWYQSTTTGAVGASYDSAGSGSNFTSSTATSGVKIAGTASSTYIDGPKYTSIPNTIGTATETAPANIVLLYCVKT